MKKCSDTPLFESHMGIFIVSLCNPPLYSDMVEKCVGYFTFSKSTFIHYQCVSTGCCVHIARIKISIDNQCVTRLIQRCDILPEQQIEKTYKAQICHIGLIWISYVCCLCISSFKSSINL